MKIRRAIAYFIDWYLITFLMNLLLVVADYMQTGVMTTNVMPITRFQAGEQVLLLIILFFLQILYFCVIPKYLLKGQTLGKKLTKIKVVNKDGSEVSFLNLWKRDILGMIVIEGCFMPLSNYIRNVLMLVIGRSFTQYFIYFSFAAGFVSIAFLLFDRKGRMLHDFIGSTKVVVV
ncbi:MAG: RDD family protein [Erysipelotrichaceae bacterium]|nr:RDD family protein [Erysipelotrichaceae bacterium]